MVPAPFGFLKMKKEEFWPDSAQFSKAKLGVTPKAFDAVDMVLAAGKLIFVMIDAPVFAASQDQAVVAEPSIGVDGGFRKHLAFDDWLQPCAGAVFTTAVKTLPPRLSSPMTGVFPADPRPRLPRTGRAPK